ncbi:MAG: HD-GYP domain-containing protein [Anaerolineae bacterium]|nr:HD-GYP domain-containing protein [Anaerolineae bacterium]
MRSLPIKVRLYISFLCLVAFALATFSYLSLPKNVIVLLELLIFTFAILLADLYPIALPTQGNAEVTVSCAFKTAAAILYGPPIAIVATFLGTLMAEFAMRRTWYKALFNASEMTLTSASIAAVYQWLSDGNPMPFHSLRNAGAVCGMVLTYVAVNVGLVTIVVSLITGETYWHVWKTNFRDSAWNNLTIIPLGAVIAQLWMYQPWSVFALVLPMIVVRKSFQYIGEMRRQTRQALIRMADAIDQRDPNTYQHSQRVEAFAAAIAREMGLPVEDVEVIRLAARLHDLGKIGMSNTLLFKPGRFTEEERREFQRHPVIGAELVRSFRLFREGYDLILHHHERYDGKGYPDGLAGEDIPLGSRILAVADSFDAMTSQRVYREPFTLEQAIQELRNNRGTQFDPDVVDAFIRVLERRNGLRTLPLPRERYQEMPT